MLARSGVGLEDCRKDSIDGMIGAWSFNVRAMSALPSTSDLRRRTLKVRFVPNADVSRCSKRCREVRSYSITRSAGARGQAEKPHRGWLWGMPIGTRRIGRALLGAGLDGLQGALDGHCNWKSSFKKALTSSWDLFAAASW